MPEALARPSLRALEGNIAPGPIPSPHRPHLLLCSCWRSCRSVTRMVRHGRTSSALLLAAVALLGAAPLAEAQNISTGSFTVLGSVMPVRRWPRCGGKAPASTAVRGLAQQCMSCGRRRPRHRAPGHRDEPPTCPPSRRPTPTGPGRGVHQHQRPRRRRPGLPDHPDDVEGSGGGGAGPWRVPCCCGACCRAGEQAQMVRSAVCRGNGGVPGERRCAGRGDSARDAGGTTGRRCEP